MSGNDRLSASQNNIDAGGVEGSNNDAENHGAGGDDNEQDDGRNVFMPLWMSVYKYFEVRKDGRHE